MKHSVARTILALPASALLAFCFAVPSARAQDTPPTLLKGQEIVQTFQATQNNLLAVIVQAEKSSKIAPTCSVQLQVADLITGTTIATRTETCAKVAQDSYIFDIPLQTDSQGKQYSLTLRSPDATGNNTIVVPVKPNAPYPNIGLSVGGQTRSGALPLDFVYGQDTTGRVLLAAFGVIVALLVALGWWLRHRRITESSGTPTPR